MSKEKRKLIPLEAEPWIVYGLLQNIAYEEYLALGEFVDNSVQSFLDNREALKELGQESVQVIIKTTPDCITINDNAGGIKEDQFDYAFRLAKPEALKTQGSLHEFGVGMKTAALWFGSRFEVETTSLGENKKFNIVFDLDEIKERKLKDIDNVQEEFANDDEHYTKIKISKLKRKVLGVRQEEYRKHLEDVYRKFLGEGILILKSATKNSSTNIKYNKQKVLKKVYWSSNKGPYLPKNVKSEKEIPSFTWEKNINFDMPEPINHVSGKAYISETFKRLDSGIVIFRNNKGILGTGKDTRYKPKKIYGTNQSETLWATLFIELDVGSNTPVTSEKTIDWSSEQEELFIDRLYEELGNTKEFTKLLDEKSKDKEAFQKVLPVRAMASNFRRQNDQKINLSDEIKKKHSKEGLLETGKSIEALEKNQDKLKLDKPKEIAKVLDPNREVYEEETFNLQWGRIKWKVTVSVDKKNSSSDWYTYVENKKKKELGVALGLDHPFTEKFLDRDGRVLKSLLRIAAGLALAEVISKETKSSTSNMRMILNKFLEGDLIQ